ARVLPRRQADGRVVGSVLFTTRKTAGEIPFSTSRSIPHAPGLGFPQRFAVQNEEPIARAGRRPPPLAPTPRVENVLAWPVSSPRRRPGAILPVLDNQATARRGSRGGPRTSRREPRASSPVAATAFPGHSQPI